MEQNKKIASILKEKLNLLNYIPTERQLYQLVEYLNLIIDTNKNINLTSITDPEEIVTKHFIDSVAGVMVLDEHGKEVNRILDVGSGAGFPGIPIKIFRENDFLTLVDSTKKKVDFLEKTAVKLGLENIICIHGRAEELALDLNHREMYDFVVARAVAPLNVLSELCLPFLKKGGILIAYKSKQAASEVAQAKRAIDLLGGELVATKEVNIGENLCRELVLIKKIKKTPIGYPRKAGKLKKRPL